MKVYELMDSVEMQGETKFVYYDYEKYERIEITEEQAAYKNIRYIYPENNIIYIEIDNEE